MGVEITETSFLHQGATVVSILSALQASGFSVAMDDFGTGYSSLSYLKVLPADTIKIDKTFVEKLPHSRDDRAIVDAVVVLAHEFDKQVIAEGVETVQQRDYLLDQGVDYMQGYLFARPMSVDEFLRYEPPPIVSAEAPGSTP